MLRCPYKNTATVLSLRAHLLSRYVGQEPVLFTGSVRDNIAKGRVQSREGQYESVQEAMHRHEAQKHVAALGCCARSGDAARSRSDEGDIEMGLDGCGTDRAGTG
jgi:ABC-type transport system involved in cytochrome bd biosynthesis fused ATPase/permease subunit